MNRKQALEHFKAGPLKEKGMEKMDQLSEYFKIHKDELVPDFVDIDIKIGNGSSLTSLRYGSNGYDDLLGWYFACESHDKMNFPFFEWAEKEHNAKIRAFGGGSGYDEFLKNPNRESLEY